MIHILNLWVAGLGTSPHYQILTAQRRRSGLMMLTLGPGQLQCITALQQGFGEPSKDTSTCGQVKPAALPTESQSSIITVIPVLCFFCLVVFGSVWQHHWRQETLMQPQNTNTAWRRGSAVRANRELPPKPPGNPNILLKRWGGAHTPVTTRFLVITCRQV